MEVSRARLLGCHEDLKETNTMLVLSRKQDEELVIKDELTGEVIRVAVVEIRGNKTRIGISASERFTVLRPESHSVQDFKRLAAKHGANAVGFQTHHIPTPRKFLP
jgi:carbon storage regulator CsrA